MDREQSWQVIEQERRRRQAFRAYGDTWQTNSDARKEGWIREYCDTEKINEYGGVP